MGDRALIVEFGERIDTVLSSQIAALAQQLRDSQPIGVLDIVPAYATLALHYDPSAVGAGAIPGPQHRHRGTGRELRRADPGESGDPTRAGFRAGGRRVKSKKPRSALA